MLTQETFALTKTKEKHLVKQLRTARKELDVEKAVERSIINMLETYFNDHPGYISVETTYPFNTDGIIHADSGLFGEPLVILLEAKRDKNFAENKKDVLDTVAQVISYLHTIKNEDPHKYPNIVVVADNNEIFMIPVAALTKYTDRDYNWSLAASDMRKDTRLINDLDEDKNIRPVINDIDNNFSVSDFCIRLTNVSLEAEYEKIKIRESSLADAFENFRKMVYGTNDPHVIQDENRAQIELFSRTLKGDEEVYAHPKKKNVLVIDNVEHDGLNTEGYEIFSSRYDANGYSLKEYKTITAMTDTLIDEVNRRFKGDYYTPEIWVNKAHNFMSASLGDDWRDEYIVWDPAAGTKNLTRDYKFSNLYSSTLYEGELFSTKHYNKDNVAFQYDFLNDDMCLHDGTYTLDDLKQMNDEELEDTFKMDTGLLKKLINKEKIVFFANPPYGANGSQAGGKNKTDVANTALKEIMMQNKHGGHAAQELYTQFYYRAILLADFFEYGKDEDDEFHIFFFSGSGFVTSPSYSKFFTALNSKFSFQKGFMINSGEFTDTASTWGIVFSHWSLNGDKNQNEFSFKALESTPENEIKEISEWKARRVQLEDRLNAWVREIPISKERDENAPISKNEYDKPTSKNIAVRMYKGWIGYLRDDMCNIQNAEKYTFLRSMGYSNAHGIQVTRENFERTAISFSIRRSVYEHYRKEETLWIHDKDIFTRPSEDLLTDEFIADCVVYSLFDYQSGQTSLRNYEYKGKKHRVENEFFPFSMQFVEELAVKHKNMDIQSDLTGEHERFVYSWLENHQEHLSDEAKALLEKAKELYEITFKYRDDYAKLYPRYQTNSWDAGYAQIAKLAFGNDCINDEFMDFKQEFYSLREVLGEKIAQAAFDDGVI